MAGAEAYQCLVQQGAYYEHAVTGMVGRYGFKGDAVTVEGGQTVRAIPKYDRGRRMITGSITNIKRYFPIDRTGDSQAWVCPEEGENFVGIPGGYYHKDSYPFVEVWKGERLARTVNCIDIAEIEFDIGG